MTRNDWPNIQPYKINDCNSVTLDKGRSSKRLLDHISWTIQTSKAGGPQALGCCQQSLSTNPHLTWRWAFLVPWGTWVLKGLPNFGWDQNQNGMGFKIKNAAHHPVLEESSLWPLRLPTFTAPWKEVRTKLRTRPPVLWGNWQSQTSDNS